jgi:hypothetical protein
MSKKVVIKRDFEEAVESLRGDLMDVEQVSIERWDIGRADEGLTVSGGECFTKGCIHLHPDGEGASCDVAPATLTFHPFAPRTPHDLFTYIAEHPLPVCYECLVETLDFGDVPPVATKAPVAGLADSHISE